MPGQGRLYGVHVVSTGGTAGADRARMMFVACGKWWWHAGEAAQNSVYMNFTSSSGASSTQAMMSRANNNTRQLRLAKPAR